MPWMRVAIGAGGSALLTGAAGMVAWINNGSHYFERAVALASAGFLTLVACVLTRVFGSSHGSQDDAFRRGRSMGYDAGYVEDHRTARPVVIPLRLLDSDGDPDLVVPFSDIDQVENDHEDELRAPSTALPLWRRERMPLRRRGIKDRMVGWVMASRTASVAGVLCLAVVGVLVADALVPTPLSAAALRLPPGARIDQAVQPSGASPAMVSKPERPAWSVAVKGSLTLVVPGVAGVAPVVPGVAGGSPAVPDATGASPAVPAGAPAVQPVLATSSVPGAGVVGPATVSTVYLPEAPSSVTTRSVAPAVAAPAIPLTAAQQTAATALAASNLTAANALAAANLTAANAAAAAAETARVAAAAAEATRLQALADAYAVAHPGA
jgi:hypothetical protein